MVDRRSKYKSSIVVTDDLIRLVSCTSLLAKTVDNFQSEKKLLQVKALDWSFKKS